MKAMPVVAMCAGTSWYLWNFRRNVIIALTQQNWKVVLIAPEDEWTARLRELPGVVWYAWPLSQNGANPVQELASLWHLRGSLKKYRPIFVFNNGIKANVYGGITCRFLRIPYANNVSGLGTRMSHPGIGGRALSRLYSFTASKGEALLVQNEADLEFLLQNGLPADLAVHRTMGSGVDLKHFTQTPLPQGKHRCFVFVGRLQKDKGIYDFVEAAEVLHDENPSHRFIVVGDTRHTNAGGVSADIIDVWRQKPFLEFVGRQDDVRPWLALAHVLVMPSHGGEGMPKAILEAAACGRPVITSAVPGCRDCVVEGATGFIHAATDIKELTRVMREVSHIQITQLTEISRAARARAEELFSEDKLSNLSVNLVRAVL